jgi:hypothetical protein
MIFNFTFFVPVLVVIFAIFGWVMATGSQKTQYVRIIDILIYGPYLIFLSLKNTYTFSFLEKMFLLLFGTTTISYNLRNFLKY